MFIEITLFINALHSFEFNFNSYETDISLIEQKEMLIHKYVADVETILIEMNIFRQEEMNSFEKTFQDIVEDHKFGRNNADMWIIPSALEHQELYYISFNDVPDPTYQIRSSILKKLFFKDLLFHYYDFCYRVNCEFSQSDAICEKKVKIIIKFFTELREAKEVSFKEYGLDRLFELISKNVNLRYFFDKLASFVCESFEMKHYQIYRFLQSGLRKCYVFNIEQRCETFGLITHFIKSYNTSTTKVRKYCLWYPNTTCKSNKKAFIDFEKKFLNCLTLDITEEFEKRLQLPGDTRFKTYKKSLKRIDNCDTCKKYCKDMLRNVICPSHRDILKTIRAEYFKFMNYSWFSDSLLVRRSVFERLYLL